MEAFATRHHKDGAVEYLPDAKPGASRRERSVEFRYGANEADGETIVSPPASGSPLSLPFRRR